MLSRVSDFLRLTLTAPVREEVALADEIDYVRHTSRSSASLRRSPAARRSTSLPDAWEAAVPAFVLQPLIENAVRHAIAPARVRRRDRDRSAAGRRRCCA
jgi:two-component system sensor histidine kinase AlgZ